MKEQSVYNLMTVLRGSVYVQLFNWHNNNASFDSFIDFRNIKRITTDEIFQLLKILILFLINHVFPTGINMTTHCLDWVHNLSENNLFLEYLRLSIQSETTKINIA